MRTRVGLAATVLALALAAVARTGQGRRLTVRATPQQWVGLAAVAVIGGSVP